MRTRWINFLVLLSLVLGLMPLTAAQAAPISEPSAAAQPLPGEQENPPAEIERGLLDKLATDGTADFVVVMAEQADLSAAYDITDWSERGWYVYDALREVAKRTPSRTASRTRPF